MEADLLPTGSAMCHGATIVEAPDGVLLAAWFGGTYEGHPDTAIWMARQDGDHWAAAEKVVDVPGVPMFNPVFFADRDRTLWLFYKVGPNVPSWTGFYVQSRDSGRSWSAPVMLPAGLIGPARNKPVLLSNGDILCGSSRETWQSWACWIEVSSDGGRTWQLRGPLAVPPSPLVDEVTISATWDPERAQLRLPEGFPGVIQPTVWEYAPGRLKMLMRSTKPVGVVCTSLSDDYGYTWSPVTPTTIPNSNSALDAVLLRDGRVVVLCNPTVRGRTPLSLLVSEDNGLTWPRRLDLETAAGEYSYPALIQTGSGRLHAVYTYRRMAIKHLHLDVAELSA